MCEELVKRLRARAKREDEYYEHGGDDINEAADAIEELQRRLEQALYMPLPRWVSVTERLPKEEKCEYWCYTDAGVMCECRWTNNKFGLGTSDKWGWSVVDVPQYQKVTHWMPLPEPPKEEGQNFCEDCNWYEPEQMYCFRQGNHSYDNGNCEPWEPNTEPKEEMK